MASQDRLQNLRACSRFARRTPTIKSNPHSFSLSRDSQVFPLHDPCVPLLLRPTMKTLPAAVIIVQAFVSLTAAAPLKVDLTRRELPTPVSVATAKTYLADRKQSFLSIPLRCHSGPSVFWRPLGIRPYGLQRTICSPIKSACPAHTFTRTSLYTQGLSDTFRN